MNGKRSLSRPSLLVLVLFLVPLVVLAFGATASADAGPKPSLTVRVVHAGSPSAYYLDLLVDPSVESGIVDSGEKGWLENEHSEIVDLPIYKYSDGDRVGLLCHGFAIWGDLEGKAEPGGTVRHDFSYMNVPRTFAVVVQDRATGEIRVSNPVTTTQFDALVQYDFTANHLTVQRNTTSFWWWLMLLVRVFLTVLVECLVVLFFRFPKRRWLPIPVNLATQGLLNLSLIVVLPRFFQTDYLLAFIVLEGIIAVLEFLAYFFWMAEKRFWKPFLYALVANGITLAIGLWWLA
jgi:hypothetical protein